MLIIIFVKVEIGTTFITVVKKSSLEFILTDPGAEKPKAKKSKKSEEDFEDGIEPPKQKKKAK